MSKNRNSTNLQYVERNEDHDDIININISWENGDIHTLQTNLNKWLASVGAPLKAVAVVSNQVGTAHVEKSEK